MRIHAAQMILSIMPIPRWCLNFVVLVIPSLKKNAAYDRQESKNYKAC